jgi:hypothetical protein
MDRIQEKNQLIPFVPPIVFFCQKSLRTAAFDKYHQNRQKTK